MSSKSPDLFAHTLAYRGRIPLEWQSTQPLDAESRHELDQQNRDLLDILLSLDEAEPEDGSQPLQHAIQKLNAKLNLLIGLVADLAAQSQLRPVPRDLSFNSRLMQWAINPGETVPAAGDVLSCRLYLRREIPKPLLLHGIVRGVDPAAAGVTLTLELDPLSVSLAERLEKYIFRWHRRCIAQSRHPE